MILISCQTNQVKSSVGVAVKNVSHGRRYLNVHEFNSSLCVLQKVEKVRKKEKRTMQYSPTKTNKKYYNIAPKTVNYNFWTNWIKKLIFNQQNV